jgi:hypothetical protein
MLQKHQRPEPVGALDFSGVSAFSHALQMRGFFFCCAVFIGLYAAVG